MLLHDFEGAHIMLKLKIRKVGNSAGLVSPKEALSHLGVENGDEVFLTETEDGGYIISPLDPDFERQMAIAKRGMKKYRNALHELAK
jgi:putative addiction module antidote